MKYASCAGQFNLCSEKKKYLLNYILIFENLVNLYVMYLTRIVQYLSYIGTNNIEKIYKFRVPYASTNISYILSILQKYDSVIRIASLKNSLNINFINVLED